MVSEAKRIAKLSEEQVECLLLVDKHFSSKEIAARLGVSAHTVDQRIRSALEMLGMERRGDAARLVADALFPKVGNIGFQEPPQKMYLARSGTGPPSEKKGGAKLSRSETVTVRLDPKLNYLCELAARAQRRTKSSFIEWAIADSLGSVILPEVPGFNGSYDVTLKEHASELWHVDEADRLAALALIAPALLTHEEQLIWRHIRENGLIWRGSFNRQGEWSWSVSEDSLIRDRLREHWDVFKGVGLGELPKEKLPTWVKTKSQPAVFDTDLDDDVPF